MKHQIPVLTAGLVVAVFLAVAPRPASAQVMRSRSLFEGANTDAVARQNLTFSFSAAEAYDDNLEAAGEPRPAQSGYFTSFVPDLRFESRGDVVSFGATGGSSVRYYSDLKEFVVVNHSVGAGMTAKLGKRTGMYVNQSMSYAPTYLYSLFTSLDTPVLGGFAPPAADYAQDPGRVHSYTYTTTGRVDRALSRRTTLQFHSDYRITNYTSDATGYYDFRSLDGGARLSTSVSRDVKLSVDYTYRKTLYEAAEYPVEQNLNVGVEYDLNRAIRAARRTTVSFHVGPAGAWGLFGDRTKLGRYILIGDASVAQGLARTWVVRGGYHRGLNYVPGLPAPVFENSTTADLGGLFNRRTEFLSSISYSAGDTQYLGEPTPFKTYAANVRLRYALARRVASYVEYFHYYFNFDQNLPLPPDFARQLTRNGVRVGVTLWVPVMKHR